MAATAEGVPIQFSASIDINNFFVPVSEGITLESLSSNFPLTAFKIKTVPQKSLLFNITGSISGLNVSFGGATSTSGSVQLVKRSGIDAVLGQDIFISSSGASINNGSGQFNFSATSSVEFNDLLYLRIIGFTNGSAQRNPSSFTASLHSFRITSEPTGSAKELVVEPYLNSPFYGTDCDVTYGNASQPVINPFLQDIDYSSGTIVPTNNEAIISGSATKGTVPESFFTIKSILNPTYKSVNTTTKYNTNAFSYNAQTSGGTFVAYYDSYDTNGSAANGWLTSFNLKYLITPDEEALEITIEDGMVALLEQIFGSNANTIQNPKGEVNGEIRTKATTISGSSTGAPLEFRGAAKVYGFDGTAFGIGEIVELQVRTTGSSAPGGTARNNSGGVIFPNSIALTSHADLPSKAREILTRNNIIAPTSTSS